MFSFILVLFSHKVFTIVPCSSVQYLLEMCISPNKINNSLSIPLCVNGVYFVISASDGASGIKFVFDLPPFRIPIYNRGGRTLRDNTMHIIKAQRIIFELVLLEQSHCNILKLAFLRNLRKICST